MTRTKATTKTTTFLIKKKAKCDKLWTLPGNGILQDGIRAQVVINK